MGARVLTPSPLVRTSPSPRLLQRLLAAYHGNWAPCGPRLSCRRSRGLALDKHQGKSDCSLRGHLKGPPAYVDTSLGSATITPSMVK